MEARYMIKGVIFDLGGVIIDWSNSTTYRYMEENFGIDHEAAREKMKEKSPLANTGKLSEREWLEDFFLSFGIEPPEGYENILKETFKQAKNNEGVVRIIKALKGNNYRLAILSNTIPSHATWEESDKVIGYFEAFVRSFEVGEKKPDAKIYIHTADALGLGPEECIFIDDRIENVEGAQAVGMCGIHFRDASQLERELKSHGVKVEVHTDG